MTHIIIAAPVRPGATSGNDVTAKRWASHLLGLGHRVGVIDVSPDEQFPTDELAQAELLVVLHARRCAPVARWWRQERGPAPMIVALAGTDLYRDLPDDADARWSIDVADALVVLQEAAVGRLASFDPQFPSKTTVIHQAVPGPLPEPLSPQDKAELRQDEFRVVVLSHLREVKDPLMCARAARLLPATSAVAVHHVGAAHTPEWEQLALEETSSNPRYWWHGPLDRSDALELLTTATVLACTSLLEGGANVVTEAIALGIPVVGTRIDGNSGLLGTDYPGLVPVGDDQALADLLLRLESQPRALADLQQRVDDRLAITDPQSERASWAELVDRLSP